MLSDDDFSNALRLHSAGQLDGAARLYERILRSDPGNARVLVQLGLVRLQQRRYEAAHDLLSRSITADDTLADGHAWLGEVLRQTHQPQAALLEFDQAIERNAAFAPAWFNKALTEIDLQDDAAAEKSLRSFMRLRPRDVRVRKELAGLASRNRRYPEAVTLLREHIGLFPADIDAQCGLADATMRQGSLDEAWGILDGLLKAGSESPRIHFLLGRLLMRQHRDRDALPHLVTAAEADSGNAEYAYQTAIAFDRLAELDNAIAWFMRAIALAPREAKLRNALGVAHLNFGNHAAAIGAFREAIGVDPKFREAHDNLLMALHYIAPIDHANMYAEHLKSVGRQETVRAVTAQQLLNGRDAARRLRVGYVSPRFHAGPLARFFVPVLDARDRGQFEIICYSLSEIRDSVTEHIARSSDGWRECWRQTDEEIIEQMRRDGIDIIVDLAGHCPGNRIGIFGARVAPIQMTWLDYVDTTGLDAMDVIILDAWHAPRESHQRFSEAVVRLAQPRLCYQPLADLPPVAPAPITSRGHATFGSFNRLSKIGSDVIQLWARILLEAPASRLILKATAFGSQQNRDRVIERFVRHGIHAARVDLRPFGEEHEMLREYSDVDVVLDPFPFNGCTTTCDALAMGVPVVTLAGSNVAGRQGVCLLSACGLADWIAESESAYVATALTQANDPASLSKLRARLRNDFLTSPVCDVTRFTRSLEAMFREQWRNLIAQS